MFTEGGVWGGLTDTSAPIRPAQEWMSISPEVGVSLESSIAHVHSP